MNRTCLIAMLIVAGLVSCGGESASPVSGPATPGEFLAGARGKVVVALLGMEGCGKTAVATGLLARLAPGLPPDVALARIDVPPPDGAARPVEAWSAPYYYGFDGKREVAGRLDFFYYPTLYVLDRDGEVRYAGGAEEGPLEAMIAEIRAEAPDAPKRIYTPPLPAVGSPAPAIEADGLDGVPATVTWDTGRPTLLLFTSLTCPFSTEAVRGLPDLALEYEERGVMYVVVEKSPFAEKAKAFYAETEMPGSVVRDPDAKVSRLFGVEPVPFFFLLDAAGNVAARGPYTEAGARAALNAALGLTPAGGDGAKPAGAG